MDSHLIAVLIGSGVTLVSSTIVPFILEVWKARRADKHARDERRAARQQQNARTYMSVAEAFLEAQRVLRQGLYDADVSHFDEEWASTEIEIRQEVDTVSDSDVRAKLKIVLDSVVDDDVREGLWVFNGWNYRSHVLEIGRSFAMAAYRNQEPERYTSEHYHFLVDARKYAEAARMSTLRAGRPDES